MRGAALAPRAPALAALPFACRRWAAHREGRCQKRPRARREEGNAPLPRRVILASPAPAVHCAKVPRAAPLAPLARTGRGAHRRPPAPAARALAACRACAFLRPEPTGHLEPLGARAAAAQASQRAREDACPARRRARDERGTGGGIGAETRTSSACRCSPRAKHDCPVVGAGLCLTRGHSGHG